MHGIVQLYVLQDLVPYMLYRRSALHTHAAPYPYLQHLQESCQPVTSVLTGIVPRGIVYTLEELLKQYFAQWHAWW